MNNKYPPFSILMSVYDAENPVFLDESIQSIIKNSVLPSEIVIVKDGCLNDSLELVLKKYDSNPLFKIVGYEKNQGLGFALNYGLEHCKYNLIARMDSDDLCFEERFKYQLDAFNNESSLSIVGSNIFEFIDNKNKIVSKRIVPEKNDQILKYCKTRNPFNHPAVMFKKKDVLAVGGYKPFFRHEDYYLWYRMLKQGFSGYNVQTPLVFMRISNHFYRRRGGFKAFSYRNKLNKIMLKDGFIGFGTYIKVFLLNLGNMLCPSFLRKKIHLKFLREANK